MEIFIFLLIIFFLVALIFSERHKVFEVEQRLNSFYPYLQEKTSEQNEKLKNLEKQIRQFQDNEKLIQSLFEQLTQLGKQVNELNAKLTRLEQGVPIQHTTEEIPEEKPGKIPDMQIVKEEQLPSPGVTPPVEPVITPSIEPGVAPAVAPPEAVLVEMLSASPPEQIATPPLEHEVMPAVAPPEAVPAEKLSAPAQVITPFLEQIAAPPPEPEAAPAAAPPEAVPVEVKPAEEIPASEEKDVFASEEMPRIFRKPFETHHKKAPPPSGKSEGLEALLTLRVFVWLGAIAFMIAGILFVKYAIDIGLITPRMRIILGIIFGIALLGMGEWLRTRSEYVAQGLSASGIAVLFASILAAQNLYQLISHTVGFIGLVLITAVAVLLSLRAGQLIAIIGLIGGFLTPYWVRTEVPKPGSLFSYLFILECGLLVATRKKKWWHLAALTLLGSLAWVIIWLQALFKPEHAIWIGLFLLFTAAAFLTANLWKGMEVPWDSNIIASSFNYSSVTASAILLAVLGKQTNYATQEWILLSILSILCFLISRRFPNFAWISWIPAFSVLTLMTVWSTFVNADLNRFYWTLSLEAVMFGFCSYALLWGSEKPSFWAALSSTTAIAFLLIGYWSHERTRSIFHFGITCIIAAAVYFVFCIPFGRKIIAKESALSEEGALTLAILSIAVTFFISLAIPVELKRQWISVAWATEVLALVWIAEKLHVPSIKKLSYPLIALVMMRLVFNPKIFTYPIGTLPVFNWLLYGYGIPIVSFVLAAYITYRKKDTILSVILQWCSITLAAALVTLEIHHYFHTQAFSESAIKFAEWGTFVIAWLLFSLMLFYMDQRLSITSLDIGGKITLLVAIALTYAVLLVNKNPLWHSIPMGSTPFFNLLLYAYGIPAVLLLIISYKFIHNDERYLHPIASITSVLLFLWLVTTETRHVFHGTFLNWRTHDISFEFTEWSTYIFGWMLLFFVLHFLGSRLSLAWFTAGSIAIQTISIVMIYIILLGARNPIWTSIPMGNTLIYNQLLYAYGIPAILLFIASRKFAQAQKYFGEQQEYFMMPLCSITGVIMLFWLVTLEIRQAFYGSFLNQSYNPATKLAEWGTYIICWILLFYFLEFLGTKLSNTWVINGGIWILMIAIGIIFFVLLGTKNPLWSALPVGRMPIINYLLYIYGVPVILLLIASHKSRIKEDRYYLPICSIASTILLFWLVTTEIRQAFYGSLLNQGYYPATKLAEWGTYVICWILLFYFLQFLGTKLSNTWLINGGTCILMCALSILYGVLLGIKNPLWSALPVGRMPVINYLLYIYGVPVILLLIAASRKSRSKEEDYLQPICSITSIVLLFWLVTMETRQAFHGTFLNWRTHDVAFEFTDWSTYIICWMLLFFLLNFLGSRLSNDWLKHGGTVILMLSILVLYLIPLIARNPLWNSIPVGGTIIFNQLLYAYGIPVILLLLVAAHMFKGTGNKYIHPFISITCIITSFWLVTLEIRQAFQGELLNQKGIAEPEKYTYSIAWILFGSILLIIGMIRKSQVLRYSSLVVIFIAIGKVFLYDTGNLTGLYRVFSYLGLGICLFTIAYLYQRFVFKK